MEISSLTNLGESPGTMRLEMGFSFFPAPRLDQQYRIPPQSPAVFQ